MLLSGERRLMALAATVATAVAAGAAVTVAAACYPIAAVQGDWRTGPIAHKHIHDVLPGVAATASWPGVGRPILVRLRLRGDCSARTGNATSTAPGIVEASLRVLGALPCDGAWHRQLIHLPAMAEPSSGTHLAIELTRSEIVVDEHALHLADPW